MSQWHLSRQYFSLRHLSISGISQIKKIHLKRFCQNFFLQKRHFAKKFFTKITLPENIFLPKKRLPKQSLTNANCNTDICPGKICSCNICPYPEYLSCYWPEFDQTLKVGSWDLFEHIPTVIMIFVHISTISWISQLLLILFWPNIKGRFLGPFWTYSNCNNDICPYQQYLNCYWADFDPILNVGSHDRLEHIQTVVIKDFQQKELTRKRNFCQKKFL